jgi:probable HAF family extracellular repeat protein
LRGTNDQPYGINASGQVVGMSGTTGNASWNPFFYTEGTTHDLNDLIVSNPGVTNIRILPGSNCINDSGEIAASGTYGGQQVALVLTPGAVPEPATAVLLVCGGALNSRASQSHGDRPKHNRPPPFFASVAVFFVFSVAPARADLSWLQSFGSYGTGSGQFHDPYGVAVDSTGNVYVADASRIVRFNPSDFMGTFASYGSTGSGDGQFLQPSGVAVDSTGLIYVVDSNNSRIVQLAGAASEPVSSVLVLSGGMLTALRRGRSRRRVPLSISPGSLPFPRARR